MTVELLDSFNRTSPPNLATNPSGRWNIPAPGGALVSDFTLDGQVAKTDTTTTASTLCWAHFYAPSVGSNYGEWRCYATRGTSNVLAIGVIARAATNTADRERYWFGITNETGTWRFELRLYTASAVYLTVATAVNCSTLGITPDTSRHQYRLKITRHGTSNLIDIVARYDDTVAFNLTNMVDTLTGLSSSNYRAPGIQALTGSTWTAATDYASFDDVAYDDLATSTMEATPALVSEPTLTATTMTTESATYGTYTHIDPDWGEEIDERFFENVSPRSEAGYRTSFARFTAGRKLWSLHWNVLDLAGVLGVALLHVNTLGAANWFYYDAPDGVTYKVHLVEDTIEYTKVAAGVWSNVSAVFEEVK